MYIFEFIRGSSGSKSIGNGDKVLKTLRGDLSSKWMYVSMYTHNRKKIEPEVATSIRWSWSYMKSQGA